MLHGENLLPREQKGAQYRGSEYCMLGSYRMGAFILNGDFWMSNNVSGIHAHIMCSYHYICVCVCMCQIRNYEMV